MWREREREVDGKGNREGIEGVGCGKSEKESEVDGEGNREGIGGGGYGERWKQMEKREGKV